MQSLLSGQTRNVRMAASALALLASMFASSAASAQKVDSRFQPWIGCWVPDNASAVSNLSQTMANGIVCVVPSATGTGVDVASISNGKVARRETIDGSGNRINKTLDGCPGWEAGSWSQDNHRLYLRSEFTCANSTLIKGSSILAMTEMGEWIQIEGTTVGKTSSANALRFHVSSVELALDPGQYVTDSMTVRTRTVATGFATRSLRILVGEKVQPSEVLDASRNVDRAVAEAWVTELGQQFSVNSKTLVAMADAGMPSTMIDLMVALSYPERFSVRPNSGDSTSRPYGNRTYAASRGYGFGYGVLGAYSDCGYSGYDSYYPDYYDRAMYGFGRGCGPSYYGSSYYGSTYGRYNYGNNYYYGNTPVIIVTTPARQVTRGQAVNGQGYTRPGYSAPSSSGSDASSTRGSSSSGSSSSGSSSSGSGSSGDGGGRTAKARGPG